VEVNKMMNKKGDEHVLWLIIVAALLLIVLVVMIYIGPAKISEWGKTVFNLADCQVGTANGECSETQDPGKVCSEGFGCKSPNKYCCYSEENIFGDKVA
jgi:hypothetical protein